MPGRKIYQDMLDIAAGTGRQIFLRIALGVLMWTSASTLCASVELTGVLENSYRDSETSDEVRSGYRFSEYLQNYQLGFRGSILSPRFCSYFLGGRYEESQKTSGDDFWRTRTKTLYDFTGNFIRNRPVSIDLFAKRSDIEVIRKQNTRERTDETIGGELHLKYWWLPRTRIGHQIVTSNWKDSGVYRTHISTIYAQRGDEYTHVEASFRDEQREAPLAAGIRRSQQFQLKGSSDLLDRTTSVSGEVNYTGHDSFESLRANFRILGRFRERDRLFVLYSFNHIQDQGFASYVSAFSGDYRRYLSEPVSLVARSNLSRTLSRKQGLANTLDSEDLSSGIEYQSYESDSVNSLRRTGKAIFDFRRDQRWGAGGGGELGGSIQWGRRLGRTVQLTHGFLEGFTYLRYPDKVAYVLSNSYLVDLIIRPIRAFALGNRVTFSDIEGSSFRRSINARSDGTLRLVRNLSLNSALTVDYELEPKSRDIYYWTNTANWIFARRFNWSAQSSWSYDRSTKTNDFWVDSTLGYRVRNLSFQIKFRDEFHNGRETRSAFARMTRTIGSKGAIR